MWSTHVGTLLSTGKLLYETALCDTLSVNFNSQHIAKQQPPLIHIVINESHGCRFFNIKFFQINRYKLLILFIPTTASKKLEKY